MIAGWNWPPLPSQGHARLRLWGILYSPTIQTGSAGGKKESSACKGSTLNDNQCRPTLFTRSAAPTSAPFRSGTKKWRLPFSSSQLSTGPKTSRPKTRANFFSIVLTMLPPPKQLHDEKKESDFL